MKTNKWILGGLMAMAITACTSDELVENTNPTLGKEVTVTAYAPGDKANSRVSFADDNTSKVTLSWKDTESFSVVYHTTAQTFSKTTAGNTFTGILPYDNENNESNYYAVYPALPANPSLTTANTVPFDLSTQTGALDESKTYMRASSSNGLSYSFQHCTAILKATFANIPSEAKISQVVVETSHADSKVDGNLDLTTGAISGGSKNTITINYTTAVDASTPVYIYLPPMAAEKKALEFEVSTTDDKTYTGTLGAANTPEPSDVESSNANQGQGIVAGKLYTADIALTEVTYCYLPKGTNFRNAVNTFLTSNASLTQIKFIADPTWTPQGTEIEESGAYMVVNEPTLEIRTDAEVFMFNETSSSMFSGNNNIGSRITSIDFNGCINTSNVTTLAYMFQNCRMLTSLDLRGFNTANVTSLKLMFDNCVALQNITFGNSFSTNKVTAMDYVFRSCLKLTSLDLTGFSFNDNLTTQEMFYYTGGSNPTENLIPIKVTETGYNFLKDKTDTKIQYSNAKYVQPDGADWPASE